MRHVTSGGRDGSHGGSLDRTMDPSVGCSLSSPVLVVHVDHALLRVERSHEQAFGLLKTRPLAMVSAAFEVACGRPSSHHPSPSANLDAYPQRAAVQRLVKTARDAERKVEWLSRGDWSAHSASRDPGSSPDDIKTRRPDASPDVEARGIAARYPEGFAYVGRTEADLPIWRAARERFGVDLSPRLRRRAASEGLGIVELSHAPSVVRAVVRSMRPHQWLKNLLVFVPFALSLGALEVRDAGMAALAFVCLCMLTSGTYLINDLFDIEADRQHPRKCRRPIASGDLPVATACGVALALIMGSLACASMLRHAFAAALAGYLVVTLAYSFRLKRLAMVDVLVIAMLFTLRIVAGMLLASEKPSHWLLMFSIFLFLSLAFMKREVELDVMRRAGRTSLSGRGYDVEDRLYVLCCGLSSGIASVVILSLFITATIEQAQSAYQAPELLWGVVGLLGYWMLRMWMLTTRGQMNDDPILFAARDRVSLVLGAVCASLAACAQLLRF